MVKPIDAIIMATVKTEDDDQNTLDSLVETLNSSLDKQCQEIKK